MSTIPAYRVQFSDRAKNARLRLNARDGLVVVVPRGFDEDRIPQLVDGKREWIRRTQDRLAEQAKFLVPDRTAELPERLVLRAIGEEWWVDYRRTDAPNATAVERPAGRLLVFGDIDDVSSVQAALQRWVSRKSHERLTPWLKRLADRHGIAFERVVVRCQRTRWASCSPKGTISLNLRLMFLPEPLVRYVLLHELAHVGVMNHSREFWTVMRAYEPDYESLDQDLRTAWRWVPSWLATPRNIAAL